jgi:dinuclear metal center YbgI/SA1388 family protein
MLLREFQRLVDEILPPATAMRGDAIGLQIASTRTEVHSVLACLEVTDAVVQEAVDRECDTIITFHPLIYTPLSRIDRTDRVGRCVADLIARDINLLSVHTTFDAFPQGTNHILAELLGLVPLRPLVPNADGRTGMGVLAACSMSYADLVERTAAVCGGPIRHVPPQADLVSTVAIVGGSGMSFFDDAVRSGADVFMTADVKYHGFHAAAGVIGMIDPGHQEMEQFVPDGIIATLGLHTRDVAFHRSTVRTNPVHHFAPQH